MNLFGLRALLFDNPVYFNLTPDPRNLNPISQIGWMQIMVCPVAFMKLFLHWKVCTVLDWPNARPTAWPAGPVVLLDLQLHGSQTQKSYSLEGSTVFCDLL
jgi:hypothetical protein